MARRDEDLRAAAAQSLEQFRSLMRMIEDGDIDGTPARIWHLRGAIDALEGLLGEERRRAALDDTGRGPA